MSASRTQLIRRFPSPYASASSASCCPRPGPEPIAKPQELRLVNWRQKRHHRRLDDFILQCGDVAGIMHLKQLSLGMMDEEGLS
jgi:hypothetical protein